MLIFHDCLMELFDTVYVLIKPVIFSRPIGSALAFQYNEAVKLWSVLSLFFLVIVVSCGPQGAKENKDLSSNDQPSTETLNQQQLRRYQLAIKPDFIHFGEAQQRLAAYQFECEDCPLSMGKLITGTIDDSQSKPSRISGNCFGGLIGTKRFLTSRHCLPNDLLEVEKNCKNRIQIIFPKLGNSSQNQLVGCNKVLALSPHFDDVDETDLQTDWAILELEESLDDRVTEVAAVPLPDASHYFLFVPLVDEITDSLVLHRIQCTTRQGTTGVPWYDQDISPLALFDCEQDITRGYSGSLVYQQTAEGYRPVATLSHIHDVQQNSEDIVVSASILASTFICLPSEELSEHAEACAFDPHGRNQRREQMIIAKLNSEKPRILAEIQTLLGDDHPLRWVDLNIDDVEAGRVTEHIQGKWQRIETLNSSVFERAGKQAFLETLSPIVPLCVPPEHIPNPMMMERTLIQMPRLRLSVIETESRQIEVDFEISALEVELFKSPLSDDRYLMGLPGPQPPPLAFPERALLSAGINHAAAALAVCQ